MYVQKTIISGDYREDIRYSVSEKFLAYAKLKRIPRDKTKLSRKEQNALNLKNSFRKLKRKIHSNFTNNDIFFTGTFIEKLTLDVAIKKLKNFFKRVREYRKKKDMPTLKYIYSIGEDNATGIHFHIIMNDISLDEVEKLWKVDKVGGRAHTSKLFFHKETGLEGLARYMMKNSLESYKEKNLKDLDEEAYKKMLLRKYVCSKNLIEPQVSVKFIKSLNILEYPKEYKGFKTLDWEDVVTSYGVYQYVNSVRIRS